MLEYETPGPPRWWESFPWKRVLLISALVMTACVVACVIMYLARNG